MSNITNMVLCAGDCGNFDALVGRANEYMKSGGTNSSNLFVSVQSGYLPPHWFTGSPKGYTLECELAIGIGNYLDLDEFVEYLKAQIDYKNPPIECDSPVQLLVKGQGDDRFKLIEVYTPEEVPPSSPTHPWSVYYPTEEDRKTEMGLAYGLLRKWRGKLYGVPEEEFKDKDLNKESAKDLVAAIAAGSGVAVERYKAELRAMADRVTAIGGRAMAVEAVLNELRP